MKQSCCHIYLNTKVLVENILKNEREKGAFVDEEEKVYTTSGITNLIVLVYEIFDYFPSYENKFLLEGVIQIAKELMITYIIGVSELLRDNTKEIPNKLLIAFSNNNSVLEEKLSEIVQKALKESTGQMTENECEDLLQVRTLCKMWLSISETALEKVVENNFEKVRLFFDRPYLHLEMTNIMQSVYEIYADDLDFSTFSTNKYLIKKMLKDVQLSYIRCLFRNKNELNESVLSNKLKKDLTILENGFTEILPNEIGEVLNIIKCFLDFFKTKTEDCDDLIFTIGQLSRELKEIFTPATIASLLSMRKDLKESKKADILETTSTLTGFKDKKKGIEINFENTVKEFEEEEVLEVRRNTLNIDDFLNSEDEIEEIKNEVAYKRGSLIPVDISDVKIAGYLSKESPFGKLTLK